MKNLLKQFLDGEIGLNIHSDSSAVLDMSKTIETYFPDAIVPQPPVFTNKRLYTKRLNDYYEHCKKDVWEVIIVEKKSHWFNAYAFCDDRIANLKLYKAEEIMYDDSVTEISETEVMDLFK